MRIPQYNIRWLGAVVESLYLALPVLSIINFLSISVVLYTNVQDYIKAWIPWMTFPIFLIIIFVITCITVLLTWMFLVPSLWALRGQQMFGKETREEKEEK